MPNGGGFNPYSPEAMRPRCPRCGSQLKASGSQYYCMNELCEIQFVKIVTKVEWVERRIYLEDRRQKQLEKALERGQALEQPVTA